MKKKTLLIRKKCDERLCKQKKWKNIYAIHFSLQYRMVSIFVSKRRIYSRKASTIYGMILQDEEKYEVTTIEHHTIWHAFQLLMFELENLTRKAAARLGSPS